MMYMFVCRIVTCSHDSSYSSSLIQHKSTPLKFERILCTAPRQYYDRLASCVVRHGGRPVWIPGIEISDLCSTEAIKKREMLIDKFSSAKYLVLPSKNAIYSCLDMCHGSVDDLQKLLHGFEIWAMGADADFLNSLGIDNVRKPEISSTSGIVKAMRQEYGSNITETCLVFAPEVVGPLTEPAVVPNFLSGLRNIGLEPVRVPAYETRIGPDVTTQGSPEVDMLIHGHVAAIAFTSTAESEGLMHIVGRQKLLDSIHKYSILVAAHGPTTAQGVQIVLGQQVDCVSKDSATFDGMITAISEKLAVK
jgi:uroporphyrinogen-III synthase